MINIKDGVCRFEDCIEIPYYNYINEKTARYCPIHKLPEMIKIKTKNVCQYGNCITTPSYNYKSEKKGLYCVKHKLPEMINIKGCTWRNYLV